MRFRLLTLSVFAAFSPTLFAQTFNEIEQQQNIQEQQRRQQLQQQMQEERDVRLPAPQGVTEFTPATQNHGPCFPIHEIDLVGEYADKFGFALKYAQRQSGFQAGACLNAEDINRIMTLAQNKVIERGYTTTRILAAPQDLNQGRLQLTLMPGFIKSFQVSEQDREHTHSGRIAAFQNEFPTRRDKLLNLHDLEQGLENLKRIPTAEADIQIAPAEQPNESTVQIAWQQRTVPIRASFSADNGGSKATGKYQGTATVSLDNPLGLSDMFYVSYGRHLGKTPRLHDEDGRKVKGKTANYSLHYSVPVGKWQWSFNRNGYRYHQAVAGANQIYDYNGKSISTDLGFSRLLYRDGKRKTHAGLKLWSKESQSYIDDAEVEVQRRRTGGWTANISHKEYWGKATVNANLAYKRGTGLYGAQAAPEQAFGEGTARMKVITADADINLPFAIGKQPFAWDSSLHAQWNKTPLTPQDKIAIGGRHTVRGFDGEMSLSAERGLYWRNTLSWQFAKGQQLYVGADAGRVSGPSAEYLLGQTLTGGAVGIRGQIKAGGSWSYDVSLAKPISRPKYFPTKRQTLAVSLNVSF